MGRKTIQPMPTVGGGSGTGLRVVGVLIGVALFALLLRDPVGAAGTVETVAAWCGQAIDALARFGAALSD
jgi:hypothetical protein